MAPPHVIAHRGDSAHRPENTLVSFQSAIEAGAEILEFDVQLSHDGQVVVIHDPRVERTTDGQGRVADLTVAELKRLSAGYPERFGSSYAGARIPTLDETLAFIQGRARALIELKPEPGAGPYAAQDGLEARTLWAIRRADLLGEVGLISFDPLALERCRQLEPSLPLGLLYVQAEPSRIVASAQALGARLLLPEKHALSPELRDLAQAAGLWLAAWVVDDPAELELLERFELYGVGSNRPGALLEALQDRAGARAQA